MLEKYMTKQLDKWSKTATNVINKQEMIKELIMANTNAPTKGKGGKHIDNILKFFTLMANGSNMSAAARLCKLSYRTTMNWKKTEWYGVVMERVKELLDEELDNSYTGIVAKAADVVMDRLEHGDTIIDKGREIRRPVSGKDASIIGSIHFDKRNLLRGKPTTIEEQQNTAQRLEELGEKFKQFARATEINSEDYIVEKDNV